MRVSNLSKGIKPEGSAWIQKHLRLTLKLYFLPTILHGLLLELRKEKQASKSFTKHPNCTQVQRCQSRYKWASM